jgi:DNA-binding transcriptional LysR family regulator
VQAGLGVTLVPPLALFARYPGVVFREPSDVSIHRRVVALTRRGAAGSPAVAAALTELRAVADRVSQRRTPPAP